MMVWVTTNSGNRSKTQGIRVSKIRSLPSFCCSPAFAMPLRVFKSAALCQPVYFGALSSASNCGFYTGKRDSGVVGGDLF